MRNFLLGLIVIGALLSAQSTAGQTADDATPLNLEIQAASQALSQPPDVWTSFFSMTAALGVVLVLIGGVAWGVRRFVPVQKIGALCRDQIEIVARKNIGGRQSLLLVRVGGALLLIGRSPGSINLLSRLDQAAPIPAGPAASAQTPDATLTTTDGGQHSNARISGADDFARELESAWSGLK